MKFCTLGHRSYICVYGIYIASLPLVAYAQHEVHSTPVQQLRVIVDGKKTPDLISDDLALNHFIIIISEHQEATAEELCRRESRILPLQLSPSDALFLVNAVSGLREQLDDIDNTRVRTGSSETLQARWNSVMTSARARVRAALTADGLDHLDAFIRQQVKPAIVIYGSN